VGDNLHAGVGKQWLGFSGRLRIAKAPNDDRVREIRAWKVPPSGLEPVAAAKKKEDEEETKGQEKVAFTPGAIHGGPSFAVISVVMW